MDAGQGRDKIFLIESSSVFLNEVKAFLRGSEFEHYSFLQSLQTRASKKNKDDLMVLVSRGEVTYAGCFVREGVLYLTKMPGETLQQIAEYLKLRACHVHVINGPHETVKAFYRILRNQFVNIDKFMLFKKNLFKISTPTDGNISEGRMIYPRQSDQSIVLRWLIEFCKESVAQLNFDFSKAHEYIRGKLRRKEVFLWQSSCEKTVSMLITASCGESIFLGAVYTDPIYRSQGYSTSLVKEVVKLCLKNGNPSCFIYVDVKEVKLRKHYEKMGFIKMDTLSKIIINPNQADQLRFAKVR